MRRILLIAFATFCALPAVATERIGEPVGSIEVVPTMPSPFDPVQRWSIRATIDPVDVGEDFGGIGGYRFAVRSIESAPILSVGLPPTGSGTVEPSPRGDGWFDVAIEFDAPITGIDGVFELASIQTFSSGGGDGVTVQVLPSYDAERGGWITWRESARTGGCSNTDPSRRPCVRPFETIVPPTGFVSDQFMVFAPHVVVTPGERFRLPIQVRCLSTLLWARSFDLASVDVPLTWENDQLILRGGFTRVADFDSTASFRTRRTFAPPRVIGNSTEQVELFALEFDVAPGATGSTLRIGPSESLLASGDDWIGGTFSGSVRVMDCLPRDFDGDGSIGADDAVRLLGRRLDVLFGDTASALDLCRGDVDRDGTITSVDATAILRGAVGLPREDTAPLPVVRIEHDDSTVRVHLESAAHAELELQLDGLRFIEARHTGGGLLASRAREGRLVHLTAASHATDQTIALELEGEGSIRLSSARAAGGTSAARSLVVDDSPVAVSSGERFLGASPNPFNPRTSLRFAVARAQSVRLDVVDARGRRVRSLDVDAIAGENAVVWDGRDQSGRPVASGSYVVRMQTETGTRTGRVLLLK